MLCIIVEKITPIQLEILVLPTLHKVAILIEVSFFLKKSTIAVLSCLHGSSLIPRHLKNGLGMRLEWKLYWYFFSGYT